MKQCCDCSLVERLFKKEEKFSIYISYNRNVNKSINRSQRRIQKSVKHLRWGYWLLGFSRLTICIIVRPKKYFVKREKSLPKKPYINPQENPLYY